MVGLQGHTPLILYYCINSAGLFSVLISHGRPFLRIIRLSIGE